MKKTSLDLSVKTSQTLAQNSSVLLKEIDRALLRIDKAMAQERRSLRIVDSENPNQKTNSRLFELLGNKQVLMAVAEALNKGDFQDIKSLG